MGYIICRDSATNQHAFYSKDVTAVRVIDATTVNVYLNSQDSSGLDVNVIQLTVQNGASESVLNKLTKGIASGESFVFDDVLSAYDIEEVTAVNSVTFNGVPDSGTFAKTIVETIDGDKTITDADSGKTFLIDKAAGLTITMPDSDAAAVGQVYKFIVKTAVTSNAIKIGLDSGDFYRGMAIGLIGTNAGKAANGTSNDFINLNGGTTGGLGGDVITLTYTDAGFVTCEAVLQHSGTLGAVFADS